MQCFFITQRRAGEGTEVHRGNKLVYFWVGLTKLSFANPEVSSNADERILKQNILFQMCDKCFNNEIESFPSQTDYIDFDLILTKKLANEKTVKHIRFVKTSEIQIDTRDYEDLGYNVYECTHCGQLWGLRDPDNSDRGYFKKITTQTIDSDTKAFNTKK